jgi:hypothetical protein
MFAGYIVGSQGLILRTTDGGNQWSPVPSGLTNTLSCVNFPISGASLVGYAVGGSVSSGTILMTPDAGMSWTPQTSGTTNWLFGVFFFDLGTGWAVGFNGTVVNTTNGGSQWEPQISGTSERLLSVHFPVRDTGWAVGYSGTILRTVNGGAEWLPQPSGVTTNLWSVYFSDASTGWAAGWSGTILHTTTGGVTAVHEGKGTPPGFLVSQNYPNPFNPATTIEFRVKDRGFVSLKVYDVLGRELTTLVNEVKTPGAYTVQWDGRGLPSGTYLCRLEAGKFVKTKKMLLVR